MPGRKGRRIFAGGCSTVGYYNAPVRGRRDQMAISNFVITYGLRDEGLWRKAQTGLPMNANERAQLAQFVILYRL